MTLVKRHDKSWLLTWTAIIVTLFLAVSLISVPTSVFGAETDEITIPDSYFRIVDVRSNHGKLVVEAQHFNADKTHWHYNLYTFEGNQAFIKDRVYNEEGEALLSDGSVAPYMWMEVALKEQVKGDDGSNFTDISLEQIPTQFVPYDTLRFEYREDEFGTDMWFLVSWNSQFDSIDTSQLQLGMVSTDVINLLGTPDDGNIHSDRFLDLKYRASADWKYGDLKLSHSEILDVISSTHLQRLAMAWNEDRGRTIIPAMPHTSKEIEGSNILKNLFSYMTGSTYKINSEGIAESYNGSLDPLLDYVELVHERTQHTKTYIRGETERQTVLQKNAHYQDENGNWVPTSLKFRDLIDDTKIMTTHPTYYALGEENSIAILTPDEEYGGRWYTPSPLTYDENSASYTHEGVTWTYQLTGNGLKLTSEPLEARGEQSYEFVFYPLGIGVQPLRIDFNGNAVTADIEVEVSEEQRGMYFYYDEIDDGPDTEPQIVIPRPYIIGANSERYDAGSWEILDDYRIGFSFDDSLLPPEAFPYTIDPTTTLNDPTYIEDASIDSGGGNNGSGAEIAIGSTSGSGANAVRSLIKWGNLNLIPNDAVVTKAEVQLYEFNAGDAAQQGNTEVELYRVLLDWTEGGVTWTSTGSTSWGCAGLICAPWSSVDPYVSGEGTAQGYNMATSTAYTTCNCWVNFSGSRMTEDVQKWISGDHPNYGWVIATIFPKEQNSSGSSFNMYSSSEHSNGNAPKLIVTYEYESAYTCPSSELRIEEPIQDGHVAHNATYSSAWSNFLLKKSNTTGTAGGYSATYATNYSDTNFWLGFFFHGNAGAHWAMLSRAYMAFDTSPLPDDAIITDGRLILHPTSVRDTQVNNSQLSSEFIRLVKIGNFANEDGTWNGVDADFGEVGDPEVYADNTFGDAPMAWDIGFANITQGLKIGSTHPWDIGDNSDAVDPGHPMVFNLNGPGKDWIDPTGHTGFGIRQGSEVTNFQSLTGGPISPGGDNWLKVAFTSKEHASYYKGNDMRPKLWLTYTKPCAMMDSTSTVSQTTTSVLYTNSSFEDGYITANPGNDMWKYHQIKNYYLYCNSAGGDYSCGSAAMTGTTNNSISSFATKMVGAHMRDYCNSSSYYGREYMGCWANTERAYLSFDTASVLSDPFTGGCSTNTVTVYPWRDGSTGSHWGHTNGAYWHTIYSDTGNQSNPNGTSGSAQLSTGPNGTTPYLLIARIVLRFDTTSLPADAIITHGRVGIVVGGASTYWDTDAILVSHEGYAGPNDQVENQDYQNFGNIPLADRMDLDFIVSNANGSTVNWFDLNTEGVKNVVPNGYSGFGLRVTRDAHSFPPVVDISLNKDAYFNMYMVEESGTARDPRLELTYQTGCESTGVDYASLGLAANSTNKGGSWYEASGGKVSVGRSFHASDTSLSLNDWLRYFPIKMTADKDIAELNTDGSTYNEFVFTPQGINYLNENYGSSSKFIIMDKPVIEDWEPDDFWNYQQTTIEWVSNEGSTAPRLMLTHGNTASTIGDASLFHTPGQTLIINTAGTKLVAAGGTFDAIRQDIINGISGSLATATDWNTAVKPNMAVSEVVRTDDDTITVTFGAFASYNPSASTESMSITVPASAHEGSQPLDSLSLFSIDQIPFSFTSFTPTLASNSASFNMTLSGMGLPEHSFTGTEDVRLIKGGQSDIVCTSVSGTGGASVIASCPVTGAVVGTWDVKATNGTGLNDTKSAALTLYQAWSSPVNGGSFTPGGSEYAAFAHDDLPYFTVHAFDEVEKEWGAGSSPPADIPAAAGKDAIFSMDKTRLVVSTASNANTLWAYEFTTGTIGAKSNPASAIVQDINDIDFSTNDNALAVAAGGGDRVYMYNVDHSLSIANFWTILVATPPDIPTIGGCSSVDFSPNSDYLAVGCDQAPYLYVWNITNGGSGIPSFGSKLSDPTPLLPSGPVSSVQFSPDGTQIAVATDTSPYVEVFEFNGGVIGAKATNPGDLPTGAATGVAWSNHNQTGLNSLAVSHASSPYLTVYSFTTDVAAPGTFGDKLADPATPLGSATNMVAFHPNDDTLFVGQSSSPYITAYEYTGHNDDDYRTYRYMANFDTSYLPDDAVITAATLSIYVNYLGNDPDIGWDIQVQDGVNGSEPLVVGDNDYTKYDGTTYPVIGSLNNATLDPPAGPPFSPGWFDITLSAYTAIDPTGISQLMLRHEVDVAEPTAYTDYPVNQTIGIHPGGSASFPSDCTTALPTAVTSDSQYNLCNSPLSPKLKLQYTSASTGSVGYQGPDLTVDFPDRQEVDEAGGSSDYGTFAITGYQHGAIAYMGIEGFGTLDYDIQYGRELVDTANDWTFFTASSPNKPFTFMKDMYLLEGVTPKEDYVGNITATTNNLKYALTGLPTAQMIDLTRSSEGATDDETTTTMSMPSDNASTDSTTGATVTTADLASALGTTESTALADATDSVMDDMMSTRSAGYVGVPMADYWVYVETLVGLPTGSLLLAVAFVIIAMSGVIAFRTFQSVAAAFICVLVVMSAFALSFGGVIPWWMIVVFALTGGIFIFSRRAYV